jgi:DNA-binding response OmpR family regulator
VRALVIEDDADIRRFVVRALSEAGFAVDGAASAGEALQLAVDGAHDVFVVDLGLPDMGGLDLIGGLRARGADAPVLILSARRSVADRVYGLEHGGDDYLPKPFAVAELVARVRALLRRRSATVEDAGKLRVADLELDLLEHRASRGGRPLDLSPREFQLLSYLASHAGRVLTRTMILDHVWRMRFDPGTNVVDVHIHRLRGKVDREATPLIHTVRAVGYVLRAD